MTALLGGVMPTVAVAGAAQKGSTAAPATPSPSPDLKTLIEEAAKDLADYQRLTAEGKLGDAGKKLDHLKLTLDELNRRKR